MFSLPPSLPLSPSFFLFSLPLFLSLLPLPPSLSPPFPLYLSLLPLLPILSLKSLNECLLITASFFCSSCANLAMVMTAWLGESSFSDSPLAAMYVLPMVLIFSIRQNLGRSNSCVSYHKKHKIRQFSCVQPTQYHNSRNFVKEFFTFSKMMKITNTKISRTKLTRITVVSCLHIHT